MGDALAVFTRVPSVVVQYQVTHVLSLCNERPEWMEKLAPEGSGEGSDSEKELEAVEEEEEAGESGATKDTAKAEDSAERKQQKRSRKRNVELPRRKMFIEIADVPKSDLLHHFESCCHFIREGRERGTVLVHCEHGVSRSVTVVLAYQMWFERRPLKILYQELKERRPEIRPNPGFMDQLRLWEGMGCRIREDNKKYRAYRLQCKAREIEDAGFIEAVAMAPDPAATPVDAALYCRCRKCRQLLFTDGDILQHDLGEGRESFQRHKQKKGRRSWSAGTTQHGDPTLQKEQRQDNISGQDQEAVGEGRASSLLRQDIKSKEAGIDGQGTEALDAVLDDNMTSSRESHQESDERGKKKDEEESDQAVLGGNLDLCAVLPDTPWGQNDPSRLHPAPLTPADISNAREEVIALRAKGAPLILPACSSYFIEPVAWMGQALLGHMEGKILCPKCNSRLGSFSWKGQQCSCGRWLTPAFQVHKNRVDEIRTLTRRKMSTQD